MSDECKPLTGFAADQFKADAITQLEGELAGLRAELERVRADAEKVHLATSAFVACFDEVAPLEGNDYIDVRHHLVRLRETLQQSNPGTSFLDRVKKYAQKAKDAEARAEKLAAQVVAMGGEPCA